MVKVSDVPQLCRISPKTADRNTTGTQLEAETAGLWAFVQKVPHDDRGIPSLARP